MSRFDVAYLNPTIRTYIEKLRGRFSSLHLLGDKSDVVCGPFGSAIKATDYQEAGIPLLRITNIAKDGKLDLSDLLFLNPSLAEKLSRTTVKSGDLVISQRGTLGIPAVVSDEYPIWCISANLIAIKDPEVDPFFLQAYLSFGPGRVQLERASSGQVQAKINTSDVASIEIPEVTQQDEIVAALETARERQRAKLAEADALLTGLGDVVLDRLGLTLPDLQPQRTTYAIRLDALQDAKTLYPDYFHPDRLDAIRTVEQSYVGAGSATLAELADFRRDQRKAQPDDDYLGLASVQSGTGERIENSEKDSQGTVFEYQANDVLFARLRPYLNKVLRAESGGVCSPEFHVMRPRTKPANGSRPVHPDYLAAVLRSEIVLRQTQHMTTGNTHPRLANEDVVNLVIPVPDSATQAAIAAEVTQRREDARRLRAEAEALWEQAKNDFEAALLGPKVTVPGEASDA